MPTNPHQNQRYDHLHFAVSRRQTPGLTVRVLLVNKKSMKFVIAGGTGQIGTQLQRAFKESSDSVVVLGRRPAADVTVWDGRTLGSWTDKIDGSDVVINLAGRTVNCRYNERNLREMMDSRVESTRVIGQAISRSTSPPRLWLQMSTSTIYAHRFDAANDEISGVIGGKEVDAPDYWRRSIEIARNWERELEVAETAATRKIAMRTSMVMSPEKGGVFSVLSRMARARLGGSVGSGRQFVSWIHHVDFIRAVRFLIDHINISGPVNLTSPNPLSNTEFMKTLREALGISIGLPATRWMAEIGAFVLRTDTELLLKSRRVYPKRLLDAGFEFEFPDWPLAAADLADRNSVAANE